MRYIEPGTPATLTLNYSRDTFQIYTLELNGHRIDYAHYSSYAAIRKRAHYILNILQGAGHGVHYRFCAPYNKHDGTAIHDASGKMYPDLMERQRHDVLDGRILPSDAIGDGTPRTELTLSGPSPSWMQRGRHWDGKSFDEHTPRPHPTVKFLGTPVW